MSVSPLTRVKRKDIGMSTVEWDRGATKEVWEELDRCRRALQFIVEWKLPPSGRFWPNEDGTPSERPMSYGAAFGSNGERDYMRDVAQHALNPSAKRRT